MVEIAIVVEGLDIWLEIIGIEEELNKKEEQNIEIIRILGNRI